VNNSEPNIKIPVDLTNPGQFFACCGLLELADRLWPGAEGWFASVDTFVVQANRGERISLELLCKKIAGCDFDYLLPTEDSKALKELTEQKAKLKRARESLPLAIEKERKRLNSKRIASGFSLGSPFTLRVDWWLIENCDGDHLKTWAGQQSIASIAKAIHASLKPVSETQILEYEALILRDGEPIAPLSFDSGRVGTAQDIGYSSDKIGQPISCSVWTEFLTLIALQRFALQPDPAEFFTFHAWNKPLPITVAAVAARGLFTQLIGCEGRFRLAGRDSGNRYKAFQQATLTEWRH
jgi:CRISPR-associated protein Csb3